MSEVQRAVPIDHAIMRAWNEYRDSAEFRNSFKHAAGPEYRTGSLWAAFLVGWNTAVERAASLHEMIDPASDDERTHKVPGAGATGAVINYRDEIRGLKP
jgi:hypothetical protein